MTVGELIIALSKFPLDLPVCHRQGYMDDLYEIGKAWLHPADEHPRPVSVDFEGAWVEIGWPSS